MDENSFKLACELFTRGIRFRYLKLTDKPGKTQALSLEVTHDY
jgi:hypothetical protein